jgi:S-DNA-T family DNA segregation ATPase FtsK/SpoIIIE
MDRQLKDMKDYEFVEKYSIDANDFETVLTDIGEQAEERHAGIMEKGAEALDDVPLLLILVQNQDAVEAVSANITAMETYKKLTTKYKALKLCFIYSNIENMAISYSSPELLKQIKETKNMLIFDDLVNHKIYDFPMNIMHKYKKPLTVGDAYYIKGNDTYKLKTVLCEE